LFYNIKGKKIKELYLRNNNIATLDEVQHLQVNPRSLAKLPFATPTLRHHPLLRAASCALKQHCRDSQGLNELRTLWLSQNPCAETEDYRSIVIAMLPQVA